MCVYKEIHIDICTTILYICTHPYPPTPESAKACEAVVPPSVVWHHGPDVLGKIAYFSQAVLSSSSKNTDFVPDIFQE